ncbi:uncharacterized protein LOC127717593 [Mytilus californianus]|uniref:uncharacterized protein LOC127717593 n=1 Tax=Mytilus californianus TaxID=6549 RepID=UPI002247521B|nr:uncharacterized protein LOC127717593 [Mytilus californianus]
MSGGKEAVFKDVNIVKPNSKATQNSQQTEIEQPTAGSSNVQQSPKGRSPEHMIDHWKSFLAVSSKEPPKKLQQNVSPKTQTSQLSDITQSLHNKGEQYSSSNVGAIISIPNNTVQFQKSETSPVNIATSRGNRIITADQNQYGIPEYQVHTAGNFQDQNINLRQQPITFINSSPQPESNVSSPEHKLVIAENIEQSLVPTKSVSPTKTPKNNVKWNMNKLVQNDDDMSTEKNKILTNLHNDESKPHHGILKSTQPAKVEDNRSYFHGSQRGQQISEPGNRVNLMFKQPIRQHEIYKSVHEQQNAQTMNYQSPSPQPANPQNVHQIQPQSQYLHSVHQPDQIHGQQPNKRENNYPNLQINHEQYTPHNPYQQLKYPPNMPNQQQQNLHQQLQYPPYTTDQPLQYLPNLANQQLQYQTETANQQLQYSPNTSYQQLQYSSNMANQQLFYSPSTANQQQQYTPPNTANQQAQYSHDTANQQLPYSSNMASQQLHYSPNTGNQNLQYTSLNMANQQLQYPPKIVDQQLQYPQNMSSQLFGSREQYPPNKANEERVQVLQPKHESFNKNRDDQQDFRQSGQKHESFYPDHQLTQDNYYQQDAKIERGQQGKNRIEIYHPNLNNQPTARQIQNQQTEVQTSSLSSQKLQHTPTQNGSIYALPFTQPIRCTGQAATADIQHAEQRSTIPNAQAAEYHKKENTQSQKRKLQQKRNKNDNTQKIELDFIASPPVLFTPEYLMLKIPKQETSNAKAVSNEKNKKRDQSPVDGAESFKSGPVKKLKLEEVRISTANIDQYPESEVSRRSAQIYKRGFKKYLLSRYEEDKRILVHSKTKILCEKSSPPPNKESIIHASSNIPLKRTHASCDLAPKDPEPDDKKPIKNVQMSVGNKEDINLLLDKKTNRESAKQQSEQSVGQEQILEDLDNITTSIPTENESDVSLDQIRLDLAMSSDSSMASDHESSSKNNITSRDSDTCSETADCANSRYLGHEDNSSNARDKNNHTSSKPVTVISTYYSQITNHQILPSFDQGRNVGFLIDFKPRRFGIVEHEDHQGLNFNAIPAKDTFSYRIMPHDPPWNNLSALRKTAIFY